jgi:signal transduction histidine kinase/ligand-binding sensor domain-containing protein
VRGCRGLLGLIVSLTWAEQLPTTVFSAKDGLHFTRRIVVDSKGFLWFPGSEGLARFDGNGFRMFTEADGLPTSVTSGILERRDGTYWVAAGEHLCVFDARPDRKRFQCESPKLGAILSLLEDERGLWCETERGLWRRAAGGAQSWESVPGLEPMPDGHPIQIGKLLKDTRGDVWVSTFSGLYRFRLNGLVERWPQVQGDRGTALSETPGSIWAVASPAELIRFQIDPRSGAAVIANRYGRSHGLPSGYVGDVRSWRGQVWAATFQGLARQLPSGAWQPVRLDPNLRGFPVGSLVIDALGNLWLSTDGGGSVRIAGSGISSFSESEGLGVVKVWAIFEDRQRNLMIVTKDEDHYFLTRFDGYRFHPVRLSASFRIAWGWSWPHIAVHSRSGEWWLATGAGLLRYAHGIETTPSIALEGNIFSVFEDSRGAIWAGARRNPGNGLYRRPPGAARFERFDETDGLPPLRRAGDVPSAFAEDGEGQIWIGMLDAGLVRFRAGRFQRLATSSGAPRRGVRAMLLDWKGRLWIGTNGDGLLRIDDPSAASPTFSAYTKASGLSGNTIQALAGDLDGRIYAATGSGIDRIDPSGAPGTGPPGGGWIRRFTVEDGLPPGEFRVGFRDRHGALWFGGDHGLIRIEPQKDLSNHSNVLVYAVRVNGHPRPISALGDAEPPALSLSPAERQLQVDFGGFRHDLLYQTRLSGLDRDWTPPTSSRSVHYLSLAPGSYELTIRAVTPDGRASATPARVRFRIAAPVWQRWWFLLLGAASIAGIAYAAHRYRLAHALAVERVRTRLAADLHDDLGSGLVEIAILTEVAGQREPLLGLHAVARRARELRSALSDIVWSVDPSGDTLNELINRWRQSAYALLGEGRLEFLAPPAQETSQVTLAPGQRRELLLVFKEIATNVARHADARQVRICVQVELKWLHLEIRDDGRGFDPGSSNSGNGLKSMRRRAETLGGRLKVDSQPGTGATVTLRVPLTYRMTM